MSNLNSVVASVPLFFNEDESINYEDLQKYVNIIINEKHAQLLYLMAYNSRINLLSFNEVVQLNQKIREFTKGSDLKYTLCTPYKATNLEVCRFLEKFDVDDDLYGVSLLFPERVYDDFSVITDYFSLPSTFGMQTLMHEMKYVSGKNGSLNDWNIDSLMQIQESCPIIGLKEDSKDDNLTAECLKRLNVDLILAGGGLTQAANLIRLQPKAWLAGVSLIRPDLAKFEYACLSNNEAEKINFFCSKIEKPFFELCSKYGWHCVHKFLLGQVHGFSIHERRPMAKLSSDASEQVMQIWNCSIAPAIDKFISSGRLL